MAKETSSARWLGKHNCDAILGDILSSDVTKEQARAAVTTYCILLGIEVDTADWDYLIRDLFFTYNSWFDDVEEMDIYMSELLV